MTLFAHDKLPSAPVLAMIDAHADQQVRNGHRAQSGTLTSLTGLPYEGRELKRLERIVQRARAAGTMSVYNADEILVKYFKVHPFFIYGELWFELSEQASEKMPEEDSDEFDQAA